MTQPLQLLAQRLEEVPLWPINIVKNDKGLIYVFSNGPSGRILEAWALTLEEAIQKAFEPPQTDPIDDLLS